MNLSLSNEAHKVMQSQLLFAHRLAFGRAMPEDGKGDFWLKVDSSDDVKACWLWRGKTNRQGYGYTNYNGNPIGAHRLAYLYETGLQSGWSRQGRFVIRHLCHNPACCNPKHLLIGTARDNKRDERMHQLGIDLVEVRLRVEAWGRVPVGHAA